MSSLCTDQQREWCCPLTVLTDNQDAVRGLDRGQAHCTPDNNNHIRMSGRKSTTRFEKSRRTKITITPGSETCSSPALQVKEGSQKKDQIKFDTASNAKTDELAPMGADLDTSSRAKWLASELPKVLLCYAFDQETVKWQDGEARITLAKESVQTRSKSTSTKRKTQSSEE